jgi:glycosyltransferase involved in cell wall biosynthesis
LEADQTGSQVFPEGRKNLMRTKISVIVPVYKVEAFIERCTRSLMEQTLREIQFIFVDDASPDGSMDIVRRIIREYDRDVRILVHPENKKLPAARNTGLSAAEGEYIYHCDSDDYLEPTMLEKMYGAAVSGEADFVFCDYFLTFSGGERRMKQPSYATGEQIVKEGFLSGAIKFNVWNKLVRRDLYTQYGISFPEADPMGEDMTMILLASHSGKVAHVEEPLYHYIKENPAAYSNNISPERLIQIRNNVSRVTRCLEGEGAEFVPFLAFFKLNNKLPFLFTGNRQDIRMWREWYPEANRYITANKYQPMRTRMVQLWAKWHLDAFVLLYAWLINKVYYGRFK